MSLKKKEQRKVEEVIQEHMLKRFGDVHFSWTLLTKDSGMIKHNYLFIVSELYDNKNRYALGTDSFDDILQFIDKNDFENGRDENIKYKKGYRIADFINSNRQTQPFGVRRIT